MMDIPRLIEDLRVQAELTDTYTYEEAADALESLLSHARANAESVEVLLEALRKWRLEYDVNSDQMIVEQTGFGGCVVKQYAADIADEVLFKFSKDILDALNAYSSKPQKQDLGN
jgi:hypothetical protein